MLTPAFTKQFRKDVGRAKRQGRNLEELKIITRAILAGEPLDAIHRDHRLVGAYVGRRECHIEADWLLIYKLEPTRAIFERMGTHSDLFQM
jgi:mRNA interferase YafQ